MESGKCTIDWTVEHNPHTHIEKLVFDTYGLPIEVMPRLIRHLNNTLFFRSSSVSFKEERELFAARAKMSPEKQLSLSLHLKNS